MKPAFDHLVVICDPGAPQADALSALGLIEGSANVHDGQGTSNRRYFFHNAYVELVWVDDLDLARQEPAFRTRLWERWMRRHDGACPFGIALRPDDPADAEARPPFPTWAYHAPYLPPQVAIGIALATPLTEPEFLYLNFATSPQSKAREPLDHPLGLREITHVRVGSPAKAQSQAAKTTAALGIASFTDSREYVVELFFDHAVKGESADLRPQLPLLLRW
ncbi:MAG TPA: VOC family protein [Candidatus Baltobacteraceae bacterium]|nr:VOC family protein [Candidatus Baltobacteraceae bacterium]